MKRAAVIVGVVLSVAVVVGAFIVGGGDNSSEAKSPTTSIKKDDVKDGTKAITNAGTQVASESPVKPEDDSDDEGDDDKGGKYEIKKASVQASPPTLRVGKELKVEVRNFQPGETVTIAIYSSVPGGPAFVTGTLKVEKNNHGKLEFSKSKLTSLVPGSYIITALGSTSGGTASTSLTVVKKS